MQPPLAAPVRARESYLGEHTRSGVAPRRRVPPLATVIVLAVVLRLALTPLYAHLPGNSTDEMFWKLWMQGIHEHGVLNVFRTTGTDYVGYHWVLWLLSIIYAWIGGPYTASTPSLHILVKMPSIVFDVALIAAVYHVTRTVASAPASSERLPQHLMQAATRAGITDALPDASRGAPEWLALGAAAIIALQPAVVYDSAVWAQTDAAIAAAMLLAIVLVAGGRTATGWAVWSLGFLVKPHPIIIAPLLLVLTLRHGRRGMLRSSAAACGVFVVVLGPWVVHGDAGRIFDVYRALFDADYERLSASAWDIWWFRDVAAHPRPGAAIVPALPLLTYRLAGLLLSASAGVIATVYVAMTPRLLPALVAAAYVAFAFYELPVSTHERYFYPFLALLLPVVMVERRWLWWYLPMSATFVANLIVVAPPVQTFAGRWVESPFSLAVAAVNLTLFAAMTVYLLILEARAIPGTMRGARQAMAQRRNAIRSEAA